MTDPKYEEMLTRVDRYVAARASDTLLGPMAFLKLSMDGIVHLTQPRDRSDAMVTMAVLHKYRRRLSEEGYASLAGGIRKALAAYPELRAWRTTEWAIPTAIADPRGAPRSQKLVGIWRSGEIYRSGGFGASTERLLILRADGRFARGSETYVSNVFRESGSTGGRTESNETGYWSSSFDDFYLLWPETRKYSDYDCKMSGNDTLLLTPEGSGNEQRWDRG